MFIYSITNKVSGKQYVGLTTTTVESRWRQHIRDSKSNNTVIAKAIRSYGADSFEVTAIDIAETEIQLSHKEQFWIAELNTTVPNGYNLQKGGFFGKATSALRKRLARSAVKRFTKPGEKEAQSERISGYFSKKGSKEKQSISIAKAHSENPKLAIVVGELSTQRWKNNRDEIIAAQRKGWGNPESRLRASEAAVKRHQAAAYDSKKKPVIADGVLFESIAKCAEHFSVADSHVRTCIKENRPLKNGVVVSAQLMKD